MSKNYLRIKIYKGKDFLLMTLIGLPGVFVYNLLYYMGAARMEASQAFIINYLWPIMSVIFACILLKEKLTFRKVIAIFLSFLGVVVSALADLSSMSGGMLLGALFIFLAAVSYGFFTGINQKFHYDKNISMMFTYLGTFIITLVMMLVNKESVSIDLFSIAGFAWNGVLVMGVATTAWAIALESGDTAKISNLAYITPFAALIWTFIFLGEVPSIFSVFGLIIIVLGILIQLKDKK